MATRDKSRTTLPTIMLVDDHPLWRETLHQVIERQAAGNVVAQAEDGQDALARIQDVNPDVVVMDVDMPGLDGIATTREILRVLPDIRVLFLSAFDDRDKIVAAVHAGACGYLLKTAGASEVAAAIAAVHAGNSAFPDQITDVLVGAMRKPTTPVAEDQNADGPRGRFVIEGEYWTLDFADAVVRLPDLKGLRHVAALLSLPGHEVLALDLVAGRVGTTSTDAGRAAQDGLHRSTSGLGGGLDAQAQSELRRRVRDLQDEIDSAERIGDQAMASARREELELIADHLRSNIGLGGRDRPTGSDAERARVSVTRGIRRAIQRIESAHEPLGRHLDRSITTGTYCSYNPEHAVAWTLR